MDKDAKIIVFGIVLTVLIFAASVYFKLKS
jgi:hypothetical protein